MTKKILVIAEKPSVALDYKKALSLKETFVEHKGYYESPNTVISYAVGHLLTIVDPKEIDIRFQSWKMDVLPILPTHYPLKPIRASESQLNLLLKLMQRKDIEMIINGCDAGREGELIFRYILEYGKEKIKNKKNGRLWLQSMTQEAILKAFEKIIDGSKMQSLYDAARSRSEADWVVGINASRALTAYQSLGGGFVLTPCGRVQTPTLMMIVNREMSRQNFTPEPYFLIEAQFKNSKGEYKGKWLNSSTKDKEGKGGHQLFSQQEAERIVTQCQGKKAQVQDTQKEVNQKPSLLYDLTTLQREANARFGYSAKMTLSIAQSLYETYKLITYPRTSSRYLPEDYKNVVTNTLEILQQDPQLGKHSSKALKNKYVDDKNKRIFNTSKVSDHFAIIPTPVSRNKKKLNERQEKIYLMILQRFVGSFFPPAKYLYTTRISEVEGETFKTEGKILLELGFKEVYDKETEDILLPMLSKGDDFHAQEVEMLSLKTTPPPHYTEATLLSAMESAGKLIEDEELREAIKETGIGTPATRAAIIEKLVEDKYVIREDGGLISTHKAHRLYDLIEAMDIRQLGSATLTGEWESKLSKIETGEIKREAFMSQIEEAVKEVVHCVKIFDESSTMKPSQFQVLGHTFHETISEYFTDDRLIVIKKVIGGRQLSPGEVTLLLENKKIGPLEGFRSRRGFAFSAILVLDENNKVQFKFEEAIDSKSLESASIIGYSPIDKSPVYMLDTQYISQSAVDGKKTGIKMNRLILGKEIDLENFQKMLLGEKTNLIEGFRSHKKKRLFDAYLNFNAKGGVEFSFPEKKVKASRKSTAVKKPTAKTAPKKSKKATVKDVKRSQPSSKVKKL